MTPVLFYHRVGPFRSGAPRKMTVTPERFRAQMRHLKRGGRRVVTLDEALEDRKGIAITFDDGYLDLMEHALPVLQEFGFPAAFFIVAGRVGGTDTWMRSTPMPEERLLDWGDLARLRDAGMTLGAHSMTHGELTREEVVASKRLIEERLGVKVEHFAYPKGAWTPEAGEWVREAGYRAGWATKSDTRDPFRRQRLPVSGSEGMVRFAARLWKARLGRYGR